MNIDDTFEGPPEPRAANVAEPEPEEFAAGLFADLDQVDGGEAEPATATEPEPESPRDESEAEPEPPAAEPAYTEPQPPAKVTKAWYIDQILDLERHLKLEKLSTRTKLRKMKKSDLEKTYSALLTEVGLSEVTGEPTGAKSAQQVRARSAEQSMAKLMYVGNHSVAKIAEGVVRGQAEKRGWTKNIDGYADGLAEHKEALMDAFEDYAKQNPDAVSQVMGNPLAMVALLNFAAIGAVFSSDGPGFPKPSSSTQSS